MTADMLDLAKRAVACKGWRWMPGMLAVEQAVPGMALSTRPVRVDEYWHEVGVWLPDLTDPATLGCLLALVREAWDQKSITSQVVSNKKWLVIYKGFGTPNRFFYGTTEVEVLVTALEVAP